VIFVRVLQTLIHKQPLDSGHGGQTKDLDGDEADGYDEGKYVDCQNSTESHRRIFKVIYPVGLRLIGS